MIGKKNEDPNLPILSFYRIHVMGENETSADWGYLGLVPLLGPALPGARTYGHTFLIARKRGLPADSPDDIGINFDSWYFFAGAPNWQTYYGQPGVVDNSAVFDELSAGY